jgi:hypothetical protein
MGMKAIINASELTETVKAMKGVIKRTPRRRGMEMLEFRIENKRVILTGASGYVGVTRSLNAYETEDYPSENGVFSIAPNALLALCAGLKGQTRLEYRSDGESKQGYLSCQDIAANAQNSVTIDTADEFPPTLGTIIEDTSRITGAPTMVVKADELVDALVSFGKSPVRLYLLPQGRSAIRVEQEDDPANQGMVLGLKTSLNEKE